LLFENKKFNGAVGEVVVAAMVEILLGKGMYAGHKALRGLPAATAFLQKGNQLKQPSVNFPLYTQSVG